MSYDWQHQRMRELRDWEEQANTFENQGDLQQAEALHRRVFLERIASLGAEHPDTQSGLRALSEMLQQQGRWPEIEELQAHVANGANGHGYDYYQWDWYSRDRRRKEEVPQDPNVCRHFLQGRCYRGQKCNFLHPNLEEMRQATSGAAGSDGGIKEEKEDWEEHRQVREALALVLQRYRRPLDVGGQAREGLLVSDLEKLNDFEGERLKELLGKKRKQVLMAALDGDSSLEFAQELQREAVLLRLSASEALQAAEEASDLAKHLAKKDMLTVFLVGLTRPVLQVLEELLRHTEMRAPLDLIFAGFVRDGCQGERIQCFELADLEIQQTRSEICYGGRQYRYHYLVLCPDAQEVFSLDGVKQLTIRCPAPQSGPGYEVLSQLLARQVADLARDRYREVLLLEGPCRLFPSLQPRSQGKCLKVEWTWPPKLQQRVQLNLCALENRIFQLPLLYLEEVPVVFRKHVERLVEHLMRWAKDQRSQLRRPDDGLQSNFLLTLAQSFATECLGPASLADHALPEDIEAEARSFFAINFGLDLKLDDARQVLRAFLTKSQFHGSPVYRQNETFLTLAASRHMWSTVRRLFLEIREVAEGQEAQAMSRCSEKASQILSELGPSKPCQSHLLWSHEVERHLFVEGCAAKPLRRLQILRDVHRALTLPLDFASCVSSAQRIRVVCQPATHLRQGQPRLEASRDWYLGLSHEELDDEEVFLMGQLHLHNSGAAALSELFHARGNDAAARVAALLGGAPVRQHLLRIRELLEGKAKETANWLAKVKEEVQKEASLVLQKLGSEDGVWDQVPKGIADYTAAPVCQVQILLELDRALEREGDVLQAARRIRYLAKVAEARPLPKLSVEHARQYQQILDSAEEELGSLDTQLLCTLSAHALGMVCEEIEAQADLQEGQTLRKRKALTEAASFYIRQLKEAFDDSPARASARFYKCLNELMETFREMDNRAAMNWCCLAPLADHSLWPEGLEG